MKILTLHVVLTLYLLTDVVAGKFHLFMPQWTHQDKRYSHFSERERLLMKDKAKQMFQNGYDNYIKYAFPQDELNPVDCKGRGPDYGNPSNININDVLGDYILTLVDTLDTLAIMNNASEFKKAVQLVIEYASFDKNNTVQVFEATIRIIGGLLSAHLLIKEPSQPFGDLVPAHYEDELLHLAHDLAARLLPSFEGTSTGIPYPRVNLQNGVPLNSSNSTCTAGAGTLILEMGVLSHLLGDPVYKARAKRALKSLWSYRSNVTGLFGNVINIQTGAWEGGMSGVGAGLDSFFEYLLKAYILFGDAEMLKMFNESYESIKFHLRRGRNHCNKGDGLPPIYVNVNMRNGETVNNWIDSLQAAWPGVQVLNGDIEEAICSHAIFYAIWRRFDALPERYNWHLKAPEILFYPLRPELVESTYLLYQATKNPFYLHVGKEILDSINQYAKVKCGYATIHDVTKKDHEDRMESFFLSETCKYLYLLFDKDNHINKNSDRYLFTTEGHLFPIDKQFRDDIWTQKYTENMTEPIQSVHRNNNISNCEKVGHKRTYFLPIKSNYLSQIEHSIGLP